MTTNKDCLFCTVYAEGKEIAGENEMFYWRYDRFPVSPGHLEVIPKRHIESFFGIMPHDEWLSLRDAMASAVRDIETRDLAKIYAEILNDPPNANSDRFCRLALYDLNKFSGKPDAYNFGINDGEAAGRTIHHLHIHVIPRYDGDVENPRGGIRKMFMEKGSY